MHFTSIVVTIFDDATDQTKVQYTTETKSMVFNDYLIQVQKLYDIENVSKYQETISNRIIQLVHTL